MFWRCMIAVMLGLGISSEKSEAQSLKTISHSFQIPVYIDSIELYTRSANVSVRRISGKRLYIQTHINSNISTEKILDILIKKGRYEWNVLQEQANKWEIYHTCRPSELIYRNMPLIEQISYIIFLPRRLKKLSTLSCRDRMVQ